MSEESRHVSVLIKTSAVAAYGYLVDPHHLPNWAAGLASAVEVVDGKLLMDSPMGRIEVEFAPANEFGVLDHEVRTPAGEVFYNPMRVLPDGDGCEVVFTVRRAVGTDAEAFEADVAAVTADLERLRSLLEG